MSLLSVQAITKKYHGSSKAAVNDVSIEVEEGEILALVGASGSGKTTLLRVIAGLEHPQSGIIWLKGIKMVEGNKSVPAYKRQVGMVFQDYALFPHLTVLENVRFGLDNAHKDDVAKKTLAVVGISDGYDKYPHQLSGGQQQRVALARAMAPSPAIILLDEPFSNLDTILKDQVREDIRLIIKKTNTTAIFVTHDTKDALSVADKIAILKGGALQQMGTPREIYEEPANAYVANFFGKQSKIQVEVLPDGSLNSSFGKINNTSDASGAGITFRPENVTLVAPDQVNALHGEIINIAWLGSHQVLTLSNPSGEIIDIICNANHQFGVGAKVHFLITKFSWLKE